MIKGNRKGTSRSYSALRRFGYFRSFVACVLFIFVLSALMFAFYLPAGSGGMSGSWLRTSRQRAVEAEQASRGTADLTNRDGNPSRFASGIEHSIPLGQRNVGTTLKDHRSPGRGGR